MTREELKKYNGKNGAKAYLAYKNKVYDVTQSELWQNGEHEGMHSAGVDLTPMLADAPHGEEVFADFPEVGILEEDEEPPEQVLKEKSSITSKESCKTRLHKWYKHYHPHPMSVHFPIALHLFAAGLDIVFLFDKKQAYEIAVFYSFFVATVMGLIAMVPGILSWWVNYNFSRHSAFIIKLVVSVVTLLLGVVAIGIYIENPHVAFESSVETLIYHGIVLLTGVNVIVLGYYGGKISWGQIGIDHTEKNSQTPLDKENEKAASFHSVDTLSILISGAAGSGIDTVEKVLVKAFQKSGYYVYSTKEFMSRVRGGSNSVLIRIANKPVSAPCWEVDIALAMDEKALEHIKERITPKTIVMMEASLGEQVSNAVLLSMKKAASEFGNIKYANSYLAGAVFQLLSMPLNPLLKSVEEHFSNDKNNLEVTKLGYETRVNTANLDLPNVQKASLDEAQKLHIMDGTTACGFGFLAGGCDFVASYPMSPSTGVLNFMASMSKEFDIAVEQSEDEIASLHFVLGAWYAGARAMTTTSGGGFALMGEALSLSGMSETPAVIYLAQRPGPATGLPTRTEQGDLNMAIYSGHGPFPRAVLAPGNLEECVACGYLAFELADKFQIPVIVLSDQYLADTIGMTEDVNFEKFEQKRYIQESENGYKRYKNSDDGISPRSVPGFGEALVCVVGDEHDERGQITEDHHVRDMMVAKRARKNEQLVNEAVLPKIFGEGNIALVGWGSTFGAIQEVLETLKNEQLSHVHFSWVYPLGEAQLAKLRSYEYIIVVENNADAAFANLLKIHDIVVDKTILQSNGFSFFTDQLGQMIEESLKELL